MVVSLLVRRDHHPEGQAMTTAWARCAKRAAPASSAPHPLCASAFFRQVVDRGPALQIALSRMSRSSAGAFFAGGGLGVGPLGPKCGDPARPTRINGAGPRQLTEQGGGLGRELGGRHAGHFRPQVGALAHGGQKGRRQPPATGGDQDADHPLPAAVKMRPVQPVTLHHRLALCVHGGKSLHHRNHGGSATRCSGLPPPAGPRWRR